MSLWVLSCELWHINNYTYLLIYFLKLKLKLRDTYYRFWCTIITRIFDGDTEMNILTLSRICTLSLLLLEVEGLVGFVGLVCSFFLCWQRLKPNNCIPHSRVFVKVSSDPSLTHLLWWNFLELLGIACISL